VTPDQLVWRVDEILEVSRTQGLEAVRQQSLAREELAYVQR
jgi:hypothetical protein